MNWEQKFDAMQALCGTFNTSLRMRKPGDWYVEASGRHVKAGNCLTGTYGNGKTPQEAVEDDWRKLVDELPAGQSIVIGMGDDRKECRWNGYMWEKYVR